MTRLLVSRNTICIFLYVACAMTVSCVTSEGTTALLMLMAPYLLWLLPSDNYKEDDPLAVSNTARWRTA